jgi:hypothetical protein
MKLAGIALLLAGMALAQRGPGGAPMGTRGGSPGFTGGRSRFVAPPLAAHPSHGRTVIVPYPVYYGYGYYGYDPSIPLAAQSAPAYDADPNNYAQGQSPVVVINQNFRPDAGNGVMRDYSDAPLPESNLRTYDATTSAVRDPQATIYLIAMQDHSIVAAIGYWVDGDTLGYITQDGNQNRVSMALVDRDFSKQLNDERHVDFKLPKSNQ